MRARPRIPASLSPREAHEIAAAFLAARRARHGDATMTAGTGEQQAGQQEGEQTGGQGGETAGQSGEQGGSSGGGQAGGQSEAKFSQADLDRIIGERVAAEKTKHEKALADAQALAGKNETEKLTIERDQATQRAQEATQKAAERVAKTEAKVAAIAAGANPDRLGVIVKNTDLAEAVDADGNVDEAKVKTLVEKTLADYPEWKAKPGGPTQSGGELNGGGGGDKPTFTRKQLEDMPPEEMAKRIDEINAAIADGRVTG